MNELSKWYIQINLRRLFYNKKIEVSFSNSGKELSSLAFLRYGQTNNSAKAENKWDITGIIRFMKLFDIAGRQSC